MLWFEAVLSCVSRVNKAVVVHGSQMLRRATEGTAVVEAKGDPTLWSSISRTRFRFLVPRFLECHREMKSTTQHTPYRCQ